MILQLLLLFAVASAAPPGQDEDVLYDQRQNGTDNFRVQMSDVTLVVAPAEALLAVAPADLFESQLKPKLADSNKPSRSKHRLANFLMNVLQKNHK
ncbi:uncharacterized protein [Halyomorpha halys]|uniref:uncharacterized protein n=1 Tax=Halyomorpha halys TaxID=286706 RepID=UPI0006D4DBD9|nr:uncharacterized protein LOC106681466 [Halyomorpha halys]